MINKFQRITAIVLFTIAAIGLLGMPIGDPKFIAQAIGLELCFIALAIITLKNYRYACFPNFVISVIVIIGNTAFYKHVEIMTMLHPLYNAIVLIVGGYFLQSLLLVTNYIAYRHQVQFSANQSKV